MKSAFRNTTKKVFNININKFSKEYSVVVVVIFSITVLVSSTVLYILYFIFHSLLVLFARELFVEICIQFGAIINKQQGGGGEKRKTN